MYKTTDYFLPCAELEGIEVIRNLKDLAYNLDAADTVIDDDGFWVSFKASIALLELDMQLLKIHPGRVGDLIYRRLIAKVAEGIDWYTLKEIDDLRYRRLIAKLVAGRLWDSNHAELIEPYLKHAEDMNNSIKGNIALIRHPDVEIPEENN